MATVVVLGKSSFSGNDFVDLLLKETDWDVLGCYRHRRQGCFLHNYTAAQLNRYGWCEADLNVNLPRVLEWLDALQPDYIVNFAAQSEVAPSWEHPGDWFQTNCVALAKLVNHLRKQTYLKKYLHVSSPEVYGNWSGKANVQQPINPSTPYAASKAAADMLLSCYQRQFGFPLVTVQSSNVVGARQQLWKLVPYCFLRIGRGEKLKLHGDGSSVKSWINVRDVSHGELAILERGRIGETYILAPDRGYSVREMVTRIAALEGKTLEEVAEWGPERPGQDANYSFDSTKARTELGWTPKITLDETLHDVQAWVKANWDELQKQPQEYEHKK